MAAQPNGRGGRGGPVENRFPQVTGSAQVDPADSRGGGAQSAKPRMSRSMAEGAGTVTTTPREKQAAGDDNEN